MANTSNSHYDLGGGERANIKMYAAKIDEEVKLLSIKQYLESKIKRRSILIFNKDNLLIINGSLFMEELKEIGPITQATSAEKVLIMQ